MVDRLVVRWQRPTCSPPLDDPLSSSGFVLKSRPGAAPSLLSRCIQAKMRQQMPTQFKLPLNTHSTRIRRIRRRRRMHYPVQRVWFIDARALSFQLFSGGLSCFVYCECVWRHTRTHTPHWHTHLVYLFKCAWALMKNPACAAWKNICACAQSASVSSVWRLWQCVGPGCHCHCCCSCWKIAALKKRNGNQFKFLKYLQICTYYGKYLKRQWI